MYFSCNSLFPSALSAINFIRAMSFMKLLYDIVSKLASKISYSIYLTSKKFLILSWANLIDISSSGAWPLIAIFKGRHFNIQEINWILKGILLSYVRFWKRFLFRFKVTFYYLCKSFEKFKANSDKNF